MGAPRDEFGVGAFSDVQVQVTLTRPFTIGRTEVTREQWASVGWEQPTYVHPAEEQPSCAGPACPVVNVTFFDALAFANELSASQGLTPCYTLGRCTGAIGERLECDSARVNAPTVYDCEGYRLPTEAEWEYAARAGTVTAFYSGDVLHRGRDPYHCHVEPNLEDVAWYCSNSAGRAHPVAQKRPNGWGLHDMLGNVGEWCNDLYDGRGYGKGPLTDPIGTLTPDGELVPKRAPGEVNLRIRRGGGYVAIPLITKSSYRLAGVLAGSSVGFRLVRTLSSLEEEMK